MNNEQSEAGFVIGYESRHLAFSYLTYLKERKAEDERKQN